MIEEKRQDNLIVKINFMYNYDTISLRRFIMYNNGFTENLNVNFHQKIDKRKHSFFLFFIKIIKQKIVFTIMNSLK